VKFLIVGLGNPGKSYEGTRHNIGFALLEELAAKYHFTFRKKSKWDARIAEGMIDSSAAVLMMPQTFMNESGRAVAPAIQDLGVDLSHLLVVVDDVAIPMGQMRIKLNSGSGGHNGLKSIEDYLQTNRFARLRLGVGDREEGDLSSHVLGRFSEEEKKLVPEMLDRAVQSIELWMRQGITRAMDFANRRPSNPSNGV
jgi:PTH1 family peptidyl-tRNA hydrolase